MAEEEGSKEQELIEQLLAEKEGLIPKGFAAQVERDLTGSSPFAVTRRLGLAYLESPWRQNAERVEADRQFAVATAHIAEVLKSHIKTYEVLVQWLRAAQTRMWLSLAAREDIDEVIAEARRLPGDDLPRLQIVVDNGKERRGHDPE